MNIRIARLAMKAAVVTTFVLCAAHAGVASSTVYVSSKGDGSDGQSWETAYKTIADGVANAPAGATVILDDETFPLSANLTIDRQIVLTSRTDKDSSIIDGKNGAYITVAATAAGTRFDEVTFTRTGSTYSPQVVWLFWLGHRYRIAYSVSVAMALMEVALADILLSMEAKVVFRHATSMAVL